MYHVYNGVVKKMNKYEFHSLTILKENTSDDRQNYLKAIEARTKQTADNNFDYFRAYQKKIYEDRNGNKLLGYLAHLVLDLAFNCLP
jgi:rhomboid protease GluP